MTDKELKDFEAINFSAYFTLISGEQNLTKVAKSFYIFLTTLEEVQLNSSDNCICHYNVKTSNLLNPKLQLFNNKIMIKRS